MVEHLDLKTSEEVKMQVQNWMGYRGACISNFFGAYFWCFLLFASRIFDIVECKYDALYQNEFIKGVPYFCFFLVVGVLFFFSWRREQFLISAALVENLKLPGWNLK